MKRTPPPKDHARRREDEALRQRQGPRHTVAAERDPSLPARLGGDRVGLGAIGGPGIELQARPVELGRIAR